MPGEDPARYLAPLPVELDPAQRAVYDAVVGGPRGAQASLVPFADEDGRLIGPFALMLIAPGAGAAVEALGAAVRFGRELAAVERELAILVVAARLSSDFEWFAHEPAALAAGLSAAQLDSLRTGEAPQGLSARVACVWSTATALLASDGLDSAEHARATSELGERGLAELVWLCGYYRMLAVALAALKPVVPPGARGVFPTRPV